MFFVLIPDKMSGPFLSFVTSRKAIQQLPAAITSDDVVNALEANISSTSIFLGGDDAQYAVRDSYDIAKREVVYSLPVGDAGKNIYYSEVPSYKFDVNQKFIRFAKFAEQRITFKNITAAWCQVNLHWTHTDSTNHVKVLNLAPGESQHV